MLLYVYISTLDLSHNVNDQFSAQKYSTTDHSTMSCISDVFLGFLKIDFQNFKFQKLFFCTTLLIQYLLYSD